MNKKYLKWQSFSWLPAFGILLLIMLAIFVPSMANINIVKPTNPDYGYYNYTNSGISYILYPSLILSCIVPLFAYSYRTSVPKVDSLMQVPFKKNEFRNTRIILALTIFLVVFTLAYWLGAGVMAIRQSTSIDTDLYTYCHFNYQYYVYVYLILLVQIVMSYFVSCFFVSFGSDLTSQIILLIMGELLLSFVLYGPQTLVQTLIKKFATKETYLSSPIALMLSFIEPVNFDDIIFNGLICYGQKADLTDYGGNLLYVGLGLYFLCGIGATVYTILAKDPSGEVAGKSGERSLYGKIIIALAALFFAAFLGTSSYNSYSGTALAITIIVYLLYVLGFYIIYVAYMRRFDLGKIGWILFGTVSIISLVFFLICI